MSKIKNQKSLLLIFAFCLLIFALPLHAATPTVLLSTMTLLPGETLRIEVDDITPTEKVKAVFMGKTYPFYVIGPNAQRALIGLRLDTPPGEYPLTVAEEIFAIEIATKVFTIENVNFTREKTELMKAERRESRLIRKANKYRSRDQQWESFFMYPVQGPVIGEYGLKRLRNRTIEAGFHKGIDLKAAKGTPLVAANTGTVVLASNFKAHGKTVLINHGQGVMTIYLHLDKIGVKVGQKVRKGQEFGKVGSTGLSTAPHVHFQVYVHSVPVDPAQWAETEF